MANYSCKKFFTTYLLASLHPLQTDGQTDRSTDVNHANSSIVNLLKYGRLTNRLTGWAKNRQHILYVLNILKIPSLSESKENFR